MEGEPQRGRRKRNTRWVTLALALLSWTSALGVLSLSLGCASVKPASIERRAEATPVAPAQLDAAEETRWADQAGQIAVSLLVVFVAVAGAILPFLL